MPADDEPRPTLLRNFGNRLRASLPPPGTAMVAGLLWGAAMAASASANLMRDGWETSPRIALVASIFALGGLVAMPIAYWLANLSAGRKQWEARLAAALIFLPLTTIAVTAALYVLVFRQFHTDPPSENIPPALVSDILLGTFASFAMFAITSVRLYFPIGLAALPLAALWIARHPR